MNIQHICIYHPSLSAIEDLTILLLLYFGEGGGGGGEGEVLIERFHLEISSLLKKPKTLL